MLPIFLLGFLLRVFKLGDQSFWADEGYGLYLASESFPELSRDIFVDLNHVPLYFFMLHFWIRVAGDSEFAVRYLSLFGGLLVVALTYRLGRAAFNRNVGLVGAALSTLAPFQVYYSQEARMHIWTTVWVLLAANGLLNAVQRPERWGGWLTYAAAATLTLYTFYFGGFALAGLTIATAILLVLNRLPRMSYSRLTLANLIPLVAFLPWAILAGTQLYQQAEHKGKDFVVYGLYDFFNLLWKTYLGGITVETDHLPWPIWPVLVLFALGVLALARQRMALLLAGFLLVPLLSVYALNLRFPHFLPRYLLFASPPFYLILAAGLVVPFTLARTRRFAGLTLGTIGLVFLVITAGQSLLNNYFNPAFARDDYRGVARTISNSAQPDDAIILNAPWQIYNFPYYYKGSLPIVGLPHEDPLVPSITDPELADLVKSRAGIWLVMYGNASMDPSGHVEQWLDENSYKVDDSWYGTIRLARYINPVAATAPPSIPRHTVGAEAVPGIRIAAYEAVASAAAGETLPVRLIWEATAHPTTDYRVSLRLVDGRDIVWSQSDSQPLDGAVPTSEWRRGDAFRDPRRLDLEPGMPPGIYRLQAVAYGGETDLQRLIDVGEVEVKPGTSSLATDPALTFRASRAEQERTGVLGIEVPVRDFSPGTTILAKAALRGNGGAPKPMQLELLDGDRPLSTGPGITPAGELARGELRRELLEVRIPNDLRDGKYRLRVVTPAGSAEVGEIGVRGRKRSFELPAGVRETHLQAGPGIEIAGTTFPDIWSPASVLTLYWRATDTQKDDLVAFIHVVDSSDNIVAQNDVDPGRSDAPTAGWAKGEIVTDERRLSWPEPRPGTYRVYAGLYRRSDGQRVGPGDGRVLLGMVAVR